jgi:uncharacterized protein YjbI with pentapeptide repeats
LNRDAEGNYKFAHRSIMEYFIAKKIVDGDKACFELEATDQVEHFLKEMVENNIDTIILKDKMVEFIRNNMRVTYKQEKIFDGLYLAKVNRDGYNFENYNFTNANFTNASLAGASFSGCNLRGTNFTGANLRGANFAGANLESTIFNESNLENANLSDATIIKTSMKNTNLTSANMMYVNSMRESIDQMDHATFVRYHRQGFRTSRFISEVNFRDAILNKTNFRGANIRGSLNLTIDQISTAETLYEAELDHELLDIITKSYTNLLKAPVFIYRGR